MLFMLLSNKIIKAKCSSPEMISAVAIIHIFELRDGNISTSGTTSGAPSRAAAEAPSETTIAAETSTTRSAKRSAARSATRSRATAETPAASAAWPGWKILGLQATTGSNGY